MDYAVLEKATVKDFWVLEEPDSSDAERRRAQWNEIRYEVVQCPVQPKHRRAGKRITQANLTIPDLEPYDFVWATWTCLVQEPALRFFRESGFRGYEVAPALIKFTRRLSRSPAFWELSATGSAGRPSKDCGSHLLSVCSGCGLAEYSRILEPSKLVDESKWDGSDFFRVEPFSSRIFVSEPVVRALRQSPLKGWRVYSLAEMREAFDIAIPIRRNAERNSRH